MMQKISDVLNKSLETCKKMKKLLYLVTAIYIVSYLIGYLMINSRMPFAMKFSNLILENLSNSPILTPIIGALQSGNLALAIAITFLVNLSNGAFASTTLPGVVPLLGAVGSMAVSGFRGFIIGAIFTYAAVLGPEATAGLGMAIVGIGTLILELGAYVFSAAVGINISLSTVFPSRYQVESRWVAFKEAWKDAGRIYIIVIILLALGAIWEMGGIYVLMP